MTKMATKKITLQCSGCQGTKFGINQYLAIGGELWCKKCKCRVSSKVVTDIAKMAHAMGLQEGRTATQHAMRLALGFEEGLHEHEAVIQGLID